MNRKDRKVLTISVVLLWIFTVVSAGLALWKGDFDWISIGSPGLMLVVALVMTVAWWWSSKDDKTD